jgi:flagellar hook-associated protein 3 FlgL
MRISSIGSSLEALNAINTDQSAYTATEAQLSSGLSVQTAADNPTAYAHVIQLQQAIAATTQYQTNSNAAQSRLSVEQQALTSVTNTLQSINELAVEANGGTLSASDQADINSQIQSDITQLVSYANTQDGNGEYVFSGNATSTQPYTMNSSGAVVYNGDPGTRKIQIGPTQTVQDGDSGTSVFGNIATGNGTFSTGASSANTGSAIIDSGTVTSAAAWVPDNYQIQFTSPTAYNVVNSANTVVSSGTYTSGSAVQFDGVSVTITGTPNTGDSFSVSKSTTQDIFTTLNNLVATIGSNPVGSAAKAQFSSSLGAAIQQLSQAMNHVNNVASAVGGRLQQITANASDQSALSTQFQTSLSQTQDLDYASAVTQMNLQYTALQAAEASYSKFSQLSLFNYVT